MGRVLAVICLAGSLLMVATPSSAADVEKVRYRATLNDHLALSGMCDFTVYVTDTGTAPMITETWVDGDLVRVDVTPKGPVYTTIEANGNSITELNSGPVTYIFNADGSVTAYQRGPSYSSDQGVITGVAFFLQYFGRGEITAVFNPDTGFFDFSSVDIVGNTTDVCAQLA
jgi:hypothetical protein